MTDLAYLLLPGLAVAPLLLPQISQATPSCIPQIEVPQAKVIRVEKNGVVVLADGRAARLEGILLPAGAGDHAPQFLADQAISALGKLVGDHLVSLAADVPKEDRYGRIRAQIFLHKNGEKIWLQVALLRKGLARVAIAPDRNECVDELYAAEGEARRAGTGLWSSTAYAVQSPSQTDDDLGTFQIVEGAVTAVSRSSGRVFLDFGSQPDSDFAATISPDDMRRFREIGVDPFAYANEIVRVRGFVERINDRPEIELATPAQVEIVDRALHRAAQ